MFIDDYSTFKQATDLEFPQYHNGRETIPGYLIDCTDGHKYLVFAPDLNCVRHILAYQKITRMVKKYMSDHEYDPIRDCIHPAFCHEKDELGDYKVLHAPVSEMGKIFIVK